MRKELNDDLFANWCQNEAMQDQTGVDIPKVVSVAVFFRDRSLQIVAGGAPEGTTWRDFINGNERGRGGGGVGGAGDGRVDGWYRVVVTISQEVHVNHVGEALARYREGNLRTALAEVHQPGGRSVLAEGRDILLARDA